MARSLPQVNEMLKLMSSKITRAFCSWLHGHTTLKLVKKMVNKMQYMCTKTPYVMVIKTTFAF